ncbi:hypothetical protein HS088_TW13G01698 [Tripterygium wilfordii]|uniref:Uncharacterized protein n=1 Tax=Tripterygium wilfordii TaxID=458696 RepID=A0A7J7CXG5_TRIWF|nr:hypothetical protein HS088_TW13G01698 [Tripterygium wilfordii]
MARENSYFDEEDNLRQALNSFQSVTFDEDRSSSSTAAAVTKLDADASEVQVTSFTHVFDDVTLYFQITRLSRQVNAEKKLVEKLINLGYTKPKLNGLSS